MSLPLYFDIDGTLTHSDEPNGTPNTYRIMEIRQYVHKGYEIVIWSARGTDYAREFCRKNSIEGVTAIGKPALIVDDNPTIRPRDKMPIRDPNGFFGDIPIKA